MKRQTAPLLGLVLLILAAVPTSALACDWCHTGRVGVCDGSCGGKPQLVEETIMVPEWTREKRVVMVTEYVSEQREHRWTEYRTVAETKMVERACTTRVAIPKTKQVTEVSYVPVTQMVERTYTVTVPVWENVPREVTVMVPHYETVQRAYTVMVPHQEVHRGVRRECRMVQVTETRPVTVDQGHWEERVVEVPCVQSCVTACRPWRLGLFRRRWACGGCGGCGGCATAAKPAVQTVSCRVWVPNLVTLQKPVTVLRPQMTEVPYEYTTTVCRPETRYRDVRVCRPKPQVRTVMQRVCRYERQTQVRKVPVCQMQRKERTRDVHYYEYENRVEMRSVPVTSYKTIPEEKVVMRTVRVPRQVEKDVEIDVCHMVPKTVTRYVGTSCGGCAAIGGVCAPAPRCGPLLGRLWRRGRVCW